MNLDTWIRNLVEDATRVEAAYRGLNTMYALGMIPSQLVGDDTPVSKRAELDMMFGILNEGVDIPDIYKPQTCGQLANWLCSLYLGEFNTAYGERKEARPDSHTESYDAIRGKLLHRSKAKHYMLRIDSGPLGHSYVLYLPPVVKVDGYRYYHYQNNCNVAMPFLTLSEWLASPRSRPTADLLGHIRKLKEIDNFIEPARRKWIFDKFTLLDTGAIKFDSEGGYKPGAEEEKLTFGLGSVPERKRGHKFTFEEINTNTCLATIRSLYVACNLPFPAGRFPQ